MFRLSKDLQQLSTCIALLVALNGEDAASVCQRLFRTCKAEKEARDGHYELSEVHSGARFQRLAITVESERDIPQTATETAFEYRNRRGRCEDQ